MVVAFVLQTKTDVALPLKEIVIFTGAITGLYLGVNLWQKAIEGKAAIDTGEDLAKNGANNP